MSDLLYKFYSAHWGREAIYRERFKITTLTDINDPFEFLATSEDKALRKNARDLRQVEFSKAGVISFSRTWQEPLLWSHYGANHSGIALGFELFNPKNGFDVDYRIERVQMPNHDTPIFGENVNFWKDIRVRKYKSWEYEQETRVFPLLKSALFENGMYFWPFEALGRLRQVILGSEYRPINDQDLNQRLKKQGIDVISTRLSFEEFKVKKQRLARLGKEL